MDSTADNFNGEDTAAVADLTAQLQTIVGEKVERPDPLPVTEAALLGLPASTRQVVTVTKEIVAAIAALNASGRQAVGDGASDGSAFVAVCRREKIEGHADTFGVTFD